MSAVIEEYDIATGKTVPAPESLLSGPDRPGVIAWMDVVDPDGGDLLRLAQFMRIALPAGRLPEFGEFYGERDLFAFTMYGVRFDPEHDTVEPEPVTVIVRPARFATVTGRSAASIRTLRRQWGAGLLVERALPYCIFLVFDSVMDTYLSAVNGIQGRLDGIRGMPDSVRMPLMFALRVQLYRMLGLLRPYRIAFHALLRQLEGRSAFSTDSTRTYYRSVNAHLQDARDDVYLCLDMLNGLVQENGQRQTDSLNVQVSRLTLLGVLLATFEVLVGMLSVDLAMVFPRLPRALGVVIMFGLLAGVAAGEMYFMKKKGWVK